jgi:hypothetical protein
MSDMPNGKTLAREAEIVRSETSTYFRFAVGEGFIRRKVNVDVGAKGLVVPGNSSIKEVNIIEVSVGGKIRLELQKTNRSMSVLIPGQRDLRIILLRVN